MTHFIVALVAFVAGAIAYRVLMGNQSRTRQTLPDRSSLLHLPPDRTLDALRHLAESNRTLHGQRIDREFSVVTATLGFYGGLVALTYTVTSVPDNALFLGVVWLISLGLAFLVFLYLEGSGRANNANQAAAEWAEDTIARILEVSGIPGFPIPEGHPNRYRWLWEVLIVVAGAIVSAALITLRLWK